MTEPAIRRPRTAAVLVLSPKVEWDFRKAYVRCGRFHRPEVNPVPGYGHSRKAVVMLARQVAVRFPIPVPMVWHLPDRDSLDGVNGEARVEEDYGSGKPPYPIAAGHAILWGKRVPIHPAMSRYLVAHEYGHVVEAVLARRMGLKDIDEFREIYAKKRRMTRPRYYGGTTWHRSPAEVFANDFRILVCGAEPEFWPHDVARPEKVLAVVRFWAAARRGRP